MFHYVTSHEIWKNRSTGRTPQSVSTALRLSRDCEVVANFRTVLYTYIYIFRILWFSILIAHFACFQILCANTNKNALSRKRQMEKGGVKGAATFDRRLTPWGNAALVCFTNVASKQSCASSFSPLPPCQLPSPCTYCCSSF